MSDPHPDLSATSADLQSIRERVGTIVVGQHVVVERMLIALLTNGHLLLEGIPGLTKTLLADEVNRAAPKVQGPLLESTHFTPAPPSPDPGAVQQIAKRWQQTA